MDLRKLLDDPGLNDDALLAISEWSQDKQDWVRVPVVAAAIRCGFNAPPILTVTADDPEHALK